MRNWHLTDGHQSLILSSHGDALPHVVYWGAALNDDLAELTAASEMDVTGGMLDANPPISLCPEASQTFPGQPGLMVQDATGAPMLPRFRYASDQASETAISLTYIDADLGLTLTFDLGIDTATRMITAQTTLTSDAPVRIHWLAAPTLPAPQLADHMIDFSGRWIGEFQTTNIPWAAGIHMRESRTGRTGHEHFPAVILPERGTTNTRGDAWAIHYGWSGGHRMVAEELPDGRRQIQFGHATGTDLAPVTKAQTAKLYATFSTTGLNGIATTFQRQVRDRIVTWPKPDTPRPVHYNCWEAIYFDHSLPELTAIADRAAALGAERFVLDDGWFGKRDDDTSSLGDWDIDPRKYPDGLGPLIDHVLGLGMTFGIWFEPEMVNPDSDLYRAHPDWALGPADQVLGRQQMVLDMANPAVGAYLYDKIAAVLSAYDIDYIKWDHNRVLPFPDAAQTRGYYALVDRLRADFPLVEIESCSSGGGRIDLGVLERSQRVWLSDSNDAIERMRIQHEAALFLPLDVTGSHVGPRHCHTSGRTLDIRLRAWIAAQRHMGFEMDPRELTEDEAQVLRNVTQWWKDNRHWRSTAAILRLDSADPSVIAEQQLASDGSRFVVFAGKHATSPQILPRPLQLTGLDAKARYSIRLLNRDDALPNLSRGSQAIKSRDMVLSGQYLMQHGLTLPWAFPETMWVIEGTRT